jgi:hypothetical protein
VHILDTLAHSYGDYLRHIMSDMAHVLGTWSMDDQHVV